MPNQLRNKSHQRFSPLWLAMLMLLVIPIRALPVEKPPPAASESPTKFVFTGNRGLSEAELRKAAEAELVDFENLGHRESDIDDAAYQMEAAYRRSGFPFAVVEYMVEKGADGPRAIFTIQEGAQVLLDKLRFEGNTAFEAKELMLLFEDNQFQLLRTGKPVFVEADIQDAVSQIQIMYRGRGYLDAVIEKPDVQFTDQNTRATVTIRIRENQQSVIHRVAYAGDVIEETRTELDRVQNEFAGQPFFPRQRFALQKKILQIYGNIGYADASVDIVAAAGDPPAEVTLTAAITSGPQVTIAAVEITGNTRTRSRFIRSRLQLKPGDIFSSAKRQESFQELYRTGIFSSVDISLKGEPTAAQRTLVVSIVETPAKEVYAEPGWGSYERLRVKVGFREANLLGTGRIFEANTQFSVKAQGIGVSLIDPWFFNTHITAELPVSFQRREEPSFTREDLSASFLLTRELSDNVTVTGGYTFKRTSLTDVDPNQFDESQNQDYDLGSIRAQIGYDTRNDIFFPTKGQKSFLSAEYADELFGGNISFGRLAGGLRYFWQVRRGTVLAARYSTGLIIPGPDQIGVPIGERFFNGGENTVRSFEESQLGPKDASKDPVGGLAYNIISVELRQQLVNRLIASLFLDLGNIAPNRSREELGKPPYSSRSEIWQDTLDDYFSDFRPAVGVGLMYLLPFGPARLDLAFNPDRDKERDEDLYVWHFSIGAAF